MSGFWRGWFVVWCVSIGLFGAVLCGGAFEATSGPVKLILSILHGAGAPPFDATLRFSLGVMGAVSIGWAVSLVFTVRAAIDLEAQGRGQGRALWRAIGAGIAAWFVIDSTLSVATGFAWNVAPNLLLAGGYAVGLMGSGVLKRPG
ncbi:hypothetical protein ACO2Q3_26355 [Caulobacter sp. KR2-114]|uniref:hypothetical protein n=1 Tax=Caulobacter sp. KR2-114 TaxID=3400912 RepID=UPI003BFDD702